MPDLAPAHPETLRRIAARLEPRHVAILRAMAEGAQDSEALANAMRRTVSTYSERQAAAVARSMAANGLATFTPAQRTPHYIRCHWAITERGRAVLALT